MDLQNQQLKELNDWLTETEERTRKMEKEPLGPDLEDLKRQVQQHKVSICYAVCFLLENSLCICVSHMLYKHRSWFTGRKELKLSVKKSFKIVFA